MLKRSILFVLLAGSCLWLQARVQLPGLYTSHMVLQQHAAITIHGKAQASRKVTFTPSWNDSTYTTRSDADGSFTLRFSTPAAGGPYTMRFSDGKALVLEDVLIGEVWLGSGQSNMEMPLAGWGKVLNYEQEIAQASYPQIRLYQVKQRTSTVPIDTVTSTLDGWQACSPQMVPTFSALAYFYARELWNRLGVPIGVIHSSWGATPCETWISEEALDGVMGFENGTRPTHRPPLDWRYPTCLYKAMIAPLLDTRLAGVIWYQGCTNVGRSLQYQALIRTLITDWRKRFDDADLPFYYVQLANYLAPSDLQPSSSWAALREAQDAALALPNTYRMVNIALGEETDIHPKNKQEVGKRLAQLALRHTYGQDIPCCAPEYDGYTVRGDSIVIRLRMPDGATALVEEKDAPGFIIAGPNGEWHVAKAMVRGEEIVVWSPEVSIPMAVRYGWADNPHCTLHTAEGFDLCPFRTDKWEVK